MTSAIKKTTFKEYQETLTTILKYIDEALVRVKNRQKNLSIWKGYGNYNDFLKTIEKGALKETTKEMGLGATTVRDRWRILTLPSPVYCAIEDNEITFSKSKYLTSINFDFENDGDIKVASEIVEEIKTGLTNPKIKDLVASRSAEIWNQSTIIMSRIAEQHGITADSKC